MVQEWPFFQLVFLDNIGQENVFYVILEQKNAFLSYQNRKLKTRKIVIFPKGLTHGFFTKMAIFPIFFFLGNVGLENVFYVILDRKNAVLSYKHKKFPQSKYWHFFKEGNPWFSSKNGHFAHFFFLGNISQENVFCNILEQKNAFHCYKNKKFKKSKNWHFSKGVNLWFWS